jgi:hypothetical protein
VINTTVIVTTERPPTPLCRQETHEARKISRAKTQKVQRKAKSQSTLDLLDDLEDTQLESDLQAAQAKRAQSHDLFSVAIFSPSDAAAKFLSDQHTAIHLDLDLDLEAGLTLLASLAFFLASLTFSLA